MLRSQIEQPGSRKDAGLQRVKRKLNSKNGSDEYANTVPIHRCLRGE